jgi:hypothetical protein
MYQYVNKKQVSDPSKKKCSPIAMQQPPGIRKVNKYTMKFNLKANILKGRSILPKTDILPLPGI